MTRPAPSELEAHVAWATRLAAGLAIVRGMRHRLDDLVSVALEALCLAWRRYDPARRDFRTFAAKRVAGAVVRAIASERRRASTELPFDHHGSDAAEPGDMAGDPWADVTAVAREIMDVLAASYLARELHAADAWLVTHETFARLHDEIARLDEEDRALIDLRYWQELPWDDVAAALDVSEGTARQRDRRLRGMLRRVLLARVPEPA